MSEPTHFDQYGSSVADTLFPSFLQHPVLIYTEPWSSTTATPIVLTTNLLSLYITNAPAAIKNKLKNLYYFRAKIRIKIVVQGQAQCFGQAVMSFFPYPLADITTSECNFSARSITLGNPVNSKLVPHIILDPSKTETYEIDLPVCAPTGYYSFGVGTGSYGVVQHVFNPVDTGTAVPGVCHVCVYMSFVDIEMDGLTHTAMTSNPFIAEKGKLSGMALGMANISSHVGNVFPVVAPWTTLFSKVAGGVGVVLAQLGYNKPPTTSTEVLELTRTCNLYSQTNGKNSAVVLANSQTTSEGISPGFGGGTLDDMDLASLIARPGLVQRGTTISPSLASGAYVPSSSFFVSPYRCLGDATEFYPTPLAGVARVFTGWRGDIDLTYEFVASVFHRATVLIAWDPNDTGAPTMEEAMATLQNVTVNISGNTTVKITIPYKQPIPLIRSEPFRPSPVGSTRHNGVVRMWVMNPVVSNGGTSGISFNVYYSSSNMKFFAPDPLGLKYFDVLMAGPQFVSDLCDVSMCATMFVSDPTSHSFGKSNDMEMCGLSCMPDVCSSVKDVTSRATQYVEVDVETLTGLAAFTMFNIPALHTASNLTRQSFFSYFGSAYLGFRGSVAWTFHPHSTKVHNSPYFRIGHSLTTPFTSVYTASSSLIPLGEIATAYAWTQPNCGVTSRGDVIAPRMSAWKYTPLNVFYDYYRDNILMEITQVDDNLLGFDVAVASGDDATFCWFLGFPTMYTTS